MKLIARDISFLTPQVKHGSACIGFSASMSKEMMHDALCVICEEMGDDEFLKSVNYILGAENKDEE